MQTWIATWVLVFAGGLFAAIVLNPEERGKSWPVALLMLAIMLAAGAAIAYRY